MRIRKLIAQKKVCPTLPSSTPTTIPVIPATSTVQPVPSICEEKEERVNNNLQTKKEEVVGVCELNMSVWDVIPAQDLLYYFSDEDFKDLKYEEEEYDDDYDDDDKIVGESVNAEEDQISIERNDIESKEDDEKTEKELVEKQYATAYKRKLWLKSLTKKNIEKRKRDCGDDIDNNVNEKKKKENGVVYCCKTDGQGLHCRSKAQKGKPLCKHHLIGMQRDSDDQRDDNQEKKIQKLEKKTAKRGRPPKESSTKTTTIRGRKSKGKLSGKKSSEFVYYSGFGPLWGKSKRGRPPNEVKKQQEDSEKEDAEEEECEKLEERQEVIDEAPPVTDDETSPKVNIVKEENVNNNGCMFIDDEFDDDSNDSDEDCNGVNVRKRYRKPIKARSLASLF